MPLPEKFPRDEGNCARETARSGPTGERAASIRPTADSCRFVHYHTRATIDWLDPGFPDASRRRSDSPMTTTTATAAITASTTARRAESLRDENCKRSVSLRYVSCVREVVPVATLRYDCEFGGNDRLKSTAERAASQRTRRSHGTTSVGTHTTPCCDFCAPNRRDARGLGRKFIGADRG